MDSGHSGQLFCTSGSLQSAVAPTVVKEAEVPSNITVDWDPPVVA